ncbi:MAG: tRNA threonylcarbamoyladenosine biosynthesis protein TsaE [Saprospiraceae bacterium]|jgi:tRNA threonylcarbamoyladenosine biosynthesis protein TsaE
MKISISSTDELPRVAQEILNKHPNKRIFLFNGGMGAGKTTLIKELCSHLGAKDSVSSPTFSIVNEYLVGESPLYHFDFYRLENVNEAHDMGTEEYFFSGHYCFIEWPEIISNLLPAPDKCVTIDIFVEEQTRSFTF